MTIPFREFLEKVANVPAFKPPKLPSVKTTNNLPPINGTATNPLAGSADFMGNIVHDLRPQIQVADATESMMSPVTRGIGNPS